MKQLVKITIGFWAFLALSIQPVLIAAPLMDDDEKEFVLSGRVLDKEKSFPVAAKIEVKDVKTHQGVAIYFSDEKNGKYLFVLNEGIYRIEVEAEGYYYTSENLVIKADDDENIKKTLFIEAIPEGAIADRALLPPPVIEEEETEPLAGESGNPVLAEPDTKEFEVAEVVPVKPTITSQEAEVSETIAESTPAATTPNESNESPATNNTGSNESVVPSVPVTTPVTSTASAPATMPLTETTEPVLAGTDNSESSANGGMIDPLSEKYLRNDDDVDAIKIKLKDGEQYLDVKLQFEPNVSALSETTKSELDMIIPYLTTNDHVVLEVGGHTDSTVSDDLSYSLSIERSKAIYNYLVQHQIENTRLKIIGYAKSHPIGDNSSELGRTMNNRVELKIVGDKDTMQLAEATPVEIDAVPILYDHEIDSINSLIIYYKKRKTKLLPDSYAILDAIASFTEKHDYTEMEISSYTDSKVKAKKARKISVKRNAAVVEYLTDKKVPKKRLVWKPLGASKPIEKGTKDEILLSNRTEFEVSGIIRGTDAQPAKVTLELVPEEKQPLDLDALFYEILDKYGDLEIAGLVYSIQVGAFTADLPDDAQLFFLVKDVRKVQDGGLSRYIVGEFPTLGRGHEYRLAIQEDGVPDAFVFGTYNGDRLSLVDLADLLRKEAENQGSSEE